MKKTNCKASKLTLHRETLRELDRKNLEKVEGGVTANSYCCPPTAVYFSRCVHC